MASIFYISLSGQFNVFILYTIFLNYIFVNYYLRLNKCFVWKTILMSRQKIMIKRFHRWIWNTCYAPREPFLGICASFSSWFSSAATQQRSAQSSCCFLINGRTLISPSLPLSSSPCSVISNFSTLLLEGKVLPLKLSSLYSAFLKLLWVWLLRSSIAVGHAWFKILTHIVGSISFRLGNVYLISIIYN